MKKKVIAMLLAVSMLLASTGCSAYGQVLKLAENYEPPIVEEVIEEVELPEEEILEEDIPNDEEAFERMEEGITEADDAITVTFENGKSFQLTEAAIRVESDVKIGYELQGTASILEVGVFTDYPASEFAENMSELMKENSGEVPFVDYHEEGIYITGIMEDLLMLSFIREDGEGQTYLLTVYTMDTDNALDITNSIISDFLASGIAGYAVRTEYGEAITELNEDELYYTIPGDYTCTYTCEYFSYFDNGEYQATLYEDQDEELERFFDGETDTYFETYQLEEIGTLDSSYGTIHIVEGEFDGVYQYFAASEDGTVTMTFTSNYADPMTLEECEQLIRSFIS
jgi:DUF971 family protein